LSPALWRRFWLPPLREDCHPASMRYCDDGATA
jgi:hypothetical protein